jgi:hypothetical protein
MSFRPSIRLPAESTEPRSLAVSTAAGQARHYRVQFRSAQDTNWQRYASFEEAEQARRCVRKLHNDGYVARLVQFSIAPAAG